MTEEKTVTLIENFVSWQGEGPDAGRTMAILRFKTCDRKCPWCDTQVKMRISCEAPYKLLTIQQILDKRNAGILVTGGEPTVPRHFDEAIMLLNELDYPIANVETNGFNLEDLVLKIDPTKPINIMYSPKIFNSQDRADTIDNLKKIVSCKNVYVKFVYEPDNDHQKSMFYFITQSMTSLVKEQRVWLMPEGRTRADLLRNAGPVFDACEKYNFNFSSRQHLIYDFV